MDWAEIQRIAGLMHTLSPREMDVVHAVGLTNKQVARRLGLSPRTIEVHRAHVLSKLGLRSWTQVVTFRDLQALTANRPVWSESETSAGAMVREIGRYVQAIADRDVAGGGAPSERLRIIRDMVAAVARG
jgi:DNA-binding CsgD family transcriptional regulator